MLIRTTPERVALGDRIRFAVLAVLGVIVGHDAVYAVGHGLGDGYRAAMAALSHDPYWVPLTLAALLAATGVLVAAALTIASLQDRIARVGSSQLDPHAHASYRTTVRRIWPRLFLVVLATFVVQENVEQLRTFGDLAGIDVLFTTTPFALPVIALVTFGLAALGALVRWRIEHLRARLAQVGATTTRSLEAIAPAREWRVVDAAAVAWLMDRRDAGRAPPRLL